MIFGDMLIAAPSLTEMKTEDQDRRASLVFTSTKNEEA